MSSTASALGGAMPINASNAGGAASGAATAVQHRSDAIPSQSRHGNPPHQRSRSSSVPVYERSSAFIHMADTAADVDNLDLEDDLLYPQQHHHTTSSTLGSSSIPPMHTIGVKRGAELLKSRQSSAGQSSQPTGNGSSSRPRTDSPTAAGGRSSNDRRYLDDLQQHDPLPSDMGHFDSTDALVDKLDVHQLQGLGYLTEARAHGSANGIDPALQEVHSQQQQSQSQQRRDVSDALMPADMLKADRTFYLLAGKGNAQQEQRQHVLSAENLAAHISSQPPHDPIVASGIPMPINRKQKDSTGTLGSPFNQQHQQAPPIASRKTARTADASAAAANAPRKSIANKASVPTNAVRSNGSISNIVVVDYDGSAILSPGETATASPPPPPATAAGGDIKKQQQRQQLGSSGKPVRPERRHPPVSGYNAVHRERTASNASDRSIKKDDLLDRLANALRSERRLVKQYQAELKAAEAEIDSILAAEKIRDEELERLQARHARDKQIISKLKLKVERQELALMRAEDVPEHEAEAYLDLLEGKIGNNPRKTSSGTARSMGKTFDDHMKSSDDSKFGVLPLFTSDSEAESEEKTMSVLIREEAEKAARGDKVALESQEWTAKQMEQTKNRRKAFKKLRASEYAAEGALNESKKNSVAMPVSPGGSEDAFADLYFSDSKGGRTKGSARAPPVSGENRGRTASGRKLSFRDSIKNTFFRGSARKNSTDSVVMFSHQGNGKPSHSVSFAEVTLHAAPKVEQPQNGTANNNAPGQTAGDPGQVRRTSRDIGSTARPSEDLPPIPIDPRKATGNSSKLFSRPSVLLAAGSGGIGEGTYGRSASMDVNRSNPAISGAGQSAAAAAAAANFVSPRASESDIKRRDFAAINESGGRYGPGIAGGRASNSAASSRSNIANMMTMRGRKLSLNRGNRRAGNDRQLSNDGQGTPAAPASKSAGSGFWHKLFPALDGRESQHPGLMGARQSMYAAAAYDGPAGNRSSGSIDASGNGSLVRFAAASADNGNNNDSRTSLQAAAERRRGIDGNAELGEQQDGGNDERQRGERTWSQQLPRETVIMQA